MTQVFRFCVFALAFWACSGSSSRARISLATSQQGLSFSAVVGLDVQCKSGEHVKSARVDLGSDTTIVEIDVPPCGEATATAVIAKVFRDGDLISAFVGAAPVTLKSGEQAEVSIGTGKVGEVDVLLGKSDACLLTITPSTQDAIISEVIDADKRFVLPPGVYTAICEADAITSKVLSFEVVFAQRTLFPLDGTNENPALIVSGPQPFNLTEAGAPGTIELSLSHPPRSPVTLPISAVPSSVVSVAPGAVSFDAMNFSQVQKLTVSPIADKVPGDRPFTVTIELGALGAQPVVLGGTVLDDDAVMQGAAVLFMPQMVVVNEAGPNGLSQVRLGTQPTDDVVLTFSSSNESRLQLGQTTLVFTPANFADQQTLSLIAIDDLLLQGAPEAIDVTIESIASGDTRYAMLEPPVLKVSLVDNEVPSPTDFEISTDGGAPARVIEPGNGVAIVNGSCSVSVVLTRPPVGIVSLPFSVPALATSSASSPLQFTPMNWDTPQLIPLTGVDDGFLSNRNFSVNFGPAESLDLTYNGQQPAPFGLTLINTDIGIGISSVVPMSPATFSPFVTLQSEPTQGGLSVLAVLSDSDTCSSPIAMGTTNVSGAVLLTPSLLEGTTPLYMQANATFNDGAGSATYQSGCEGAGFFLLDNTAPSTPSGPITLTPSMSDTTASWGASTDSGGSGVAQYEVYFCSGMGCVFPGSPQLSTPTLSASLPFTGCADLSVKVIAKDAVGLSSTPLTTTDLTLPLVASSSINLRRNAGHLELSWVPSPSATNYVVCVGNLANACTTGAFHPVSPLGVASAIVPLSETDTTVAVRVQGACPDAVSPDFTIPPRPLLRLPEPSSERTGSPNDRLGASSMLMPDVTGDGLADVVFGSPSTVDEGEVVVLAGVDNHVVHLARGANAGTADDFGSALEWLSDVNGDGYPELLIGAPRADMGASDSGAVYIISVATRETLHVIQNPSPQVGTKFGAALLRVGDLNGDGHDDFIVGAPGQGNGSIYAFSGLGFTQIGPARGSFNVSEDLAFGASLARVDDVDGDLLPDIAVGAPSTDVPMKIGAGRVYLVSAKFGVGGATEIFHHDGFTVGGQMGFALTGLGDVDDDGKSDFIASSPGGGIASVFTGANVNLYNIANTVCSAPGANFGSALGFAGDMDGDGRGDFIMGSDVCNAAGDGRWEVRSGVDGAVLYSQPGSANLGLGTSVASGYDVDGDGINDFAVGGKNSLSGFVRVSRVDTTLADEIISVRPLASILEKPNGDGYRQVPGALIDVTSASPRTFFPNNGATLSSLAPRGGLTLVSNTVTLTTGTAGALDAIRFEKPDGRSVDSVVRNVASAPSGALARSAPGNAEGFGQAIVALGDINGDSIGDWAIGAPGASGVTGRVVIIDGSDPAGPPIKTILGPTVDGAFGASLAAFQMDDDINVTLLVGAPNEMVSVFAHCGRVYSYCANCAPGSDLNQTLSPAGPTGGLQFGRQITVIGKGEPFGLTTIAIGAPTEGPDPGRVVLYDSDAGAFGFTGTLVNPTPEDDDFGVALAGGVDIDGLPGADLVVGAPKASGDSGSVLVFHYTFATGWELQTQILGGSNERMGASVAVAPKLDPFSPGPVNLIVGSPGAASGNGWVTVYHHNGGLQFDARYEGSPGSHVGAAVIPVGDFDGDHSQDLAVSTTDGDGTVSLVGFNSVGSLVEQSRFQGPAAQGGAFGAALVSLAPLQDDGRRALLVGAPMQGSGVVHFIEPLALAAMPKLSRPATLQATNITQTSFDLSWNSVSGATDYVVEYRLVGPNPWWSLGTPASTTVNVGPLPPGQRYLFRVKARTALTESTWSYQKSVATLP